MQFFVNQFSPAPPTPTPQLKSKFKSPKGRMLYNNTWSQDFSYCKHERSEPKDDDDVHRSFADLTDRKFWKIKNPLPPSCINIRNLCRRLWVVQQSPTTKTIKNKHCWFVKTAEAEIILNKNVPKGLNIKWPETLVLK